MIRVSVNSDTYGCVLRPRPKKMDTSETFAHRTVVCVYRSDYNHLFIVGDQNLLVCDVFFVCVFIGS